MAERLHLILASQSRSRREMLERAGISFSVEPAHLDERGIRLALEDGDEQTSEPADIAEVLAQAKALAVARLNPAALVIGSDQVLALDSEILEKPPDITAARSHLLRLRGRTHYLHAAVALARGEEIVWSCTDVAELTMRSFSESFLVQYLARVGERACESVGAYQLEGLGVQLFEQVTGDFFTILGMPLVPLLEELRQRGVIAT